MIEIMPPSIVYPYQDGLYINLTNRCPVACSFCVKSAWKWSYRGHDLRLRREPPAADIIEALGDLKRHRELVFCGFGESTYRLEELKAVARAARARGIRSIRLNTIGLANLIHRRDVVPDLVGLVDAASISLNTADPDQWREIHRPLTAYAGEGFSAVTEFIRSAARLLPRAVVTAVDLPGVDIPRLQALATELGASFKLRPQLRDEEARA